MQKKVTITQEEYAEYRKLRKYRRMVTDKYIEQKKDICQCLVSGMFFTLISLSN